MTIKIPSLVERREDIPLLIEYFIDYYNKAFKLNVQGVSTEVMRVFSEHDWPGNIRELRHLIEHAMNLVQDEVIEKSTSLAYFLKG